MKQTIYINFDGVMVDTPQYIRKSIENTENSIEILKTLPWDKFLKNCNEINNNVTNIKKLRKKFNIIVLTHVYSELEVQQKRKYIKEKIGNIKIITVPYYLNKNDIVNPKNNILIDDYILNIEKWNNAGGTGILFNKNYTIYDLLSTNLYN